MVFLQYWCWNGFRSRAGLVLGIISDLLFVFCCRSTTDYGHPERGFLKILNFWAWADKLGRNFMRHLGYFWPNCKHYFGTVSPLSMGKWIWLFALQKTLVFKPKTYISQIYPKYDIGRKEFGKLLSNIRRRCN